MDTALHTAGPNAQPDPEQDRPSAPMPPRITEVFSLLQILITYGIHLAGIINHPVLGRGFTTIAQFFGTVAVPDIAARIQRGVMRAIALEALLVRRAQRGRDLIISQPGTNAPRNAPPITPPPEQACPTPKPPKTPKPPLTLSTPPTIKEIEAEVRRRPIGRTIAAICLDLGISPTLCAGPFWDRLFNAMQDYRGKLGVVMTELRRREKRFNSEEWKRTTLPWPERTREGVHQALGFFIGEDPYQPAPAATAGPS